MTGKKILVVDDEKDIVDTIKTYLEGRGYDILEAYNGDEALAEAKKSPDLILLDIMMPGIDGFEVLRRLRNNVITDKIPVIMLTSKRETKSIFESQNLRATDYIVKPFSLDKMLDLIDRYLDDDRRRPIKI